MLSPNAFPLFIPAILWLIAGPPYIRMLQQKMFGQYIREDGPESHHQKAGTPTMGGLLILLTVLVSFAGFALYRPQLFWTPEAMLALLVLLVFGGLGFSDDYLKVAKKKNKGISGWTKLLVQGLVGAAVGLWIVFSNQGTDISVFNLGIVHLGLAYPLFAAFVITGASNAYNLTDGLDGLAAGCGFITFMGLAFLLVGNPSLMVMALLLAGGCLGFLVFNRYPAKIFMGDTGSLALGGVIGAMALLGKIEIFLLLLAAVYILETISVILQVAYFKATKGKRLFKMSPIHHHFELSGWKEPTIVFTFTMAQALCSILAVLLYNKA